MPPAASPISPMKGNLQYNWNLRRRGWITLDVLLSAAAILAAYALEPRFDFGWASSNPSQPGAYPAALIYPWLVLIAGHLTSFAAWYCH